MNKNIKTLVESLLDDGFYDEPGNIIDSILRPLNYEIIDLELPSGTLWSDKNIGAQTVSDTGLYFQWGDTKGKKPNTNESYCKWETYVMSKDNKGIKFSKYNKNNVKYILDNSDDAAFVNTDGALCMPTTEQFEELFTYCNYKWTTIDKAEGVLFTSPKNGNSVFFPAAGYLYGPYRSVDAEYNTAKYWSKNNWVSNEYTEYIKNPVAWAELLYFSKSMNNRDSEKPKIDRRFRYFGLPVRGVIL